MSELKRYQAIHAGIDGELRLSWIVEGEAGAIEYHHDVDQKPTNAARSTFGDHGYPGVEVHSRTPRREGDTPLGGYCWLLQAPCYVDGSSTAGEELWPLAHIPDFECLWAELEEWYRDNFGEAAELRAQAAEEVAS
jgi:hypothetical protein